MPKVQRSIGQVLTAVKLEFPDISISKIRFLETEGLLSPERAPSGYRKYSESDVERLRYILQMQKNHYLPLKVIREHLDMMDRGLTPPSVEPPTPGVVSEPIQDPLPVDEAEEAAPASAVVASVESPRTSTKPPIRMSRRELLEASGLSEAMMIELERQLVIQPRRGTVYYGREALAIAVVARKLGAYGMDARHIRAIKQAAEREVGLVEQAISPYVRRGPSSREVTAEVLQLVMRAHAALMYQTMNP